MRMFDIIKKKRDGFELTDDEIKFVINGYIDGSVPEYQMSAFLMAIYYKSMTTREIVTLTKCIENSGEHVNLGQVKGYKADKHSTGGVGDKTTFIVAPLAAACGIKVAKISGRGLGHTGGTVDKLEAIPGYQTSLHIDRFQEIVNKVGVSVIGQNQELAPADKKIYALRDVTATVDSLPLIASSIMGKKLAAADDGIVLELTIGNGSFNKTMEDGVKLARVMVDIGNAAGKKTVAVLTDMNQPLGKTIGNSLEVIEALEVLKNGDGDKRLVDLSIELTASMINLAGMGTLEECREIAKENLKNGNAYKKFYEMVKEQGGDVKYIEDTSLFDLGKTREFVAETSGYISEVNTEGYGLASLYLGAGRNKIEDKIDFSAGIEIVKKLGDYVEKGETIAVMHTSDTTKFDSAYKKLAESTIVSNNKVQPNDVVLGRIE